MEIHDERRQLAGVANLVLIPFLTTVIFKLFSEPTSRSKKLGLNERRIKAVMYVKERGAINNSKYQDINNIGKTTATEDLQKLVKMGILAEPTAKGRGAKYELKN